MNLNRPFQKSCVSSLLLVAALFFSHIICSASPAREYEQQQSQSQQQPPPPPTVPLNSQAASPQTPPTDPTAAKQHKVWTNDDVVLLRTPADNYRVEKEAREAAEAEAATREAAHKAAAKSDKEPPLDIRLPDTPQETEKMLKDTQGDIQEETDALDKLHKDMLDTSAEQQSEKQKEIDRLTGNLQTLQRDVKALQEHLRTIREKSQGENPPAAAQPPSV